MLAPSSLSFSFFFFNDTATTEIYTLSLHDALPISGPRGPRPVARRDRGRSREGGVVRRVPRCERADRRRPSRGAGDGGRRARPSGNRGARRAVAAQPPEWRARAVGRGFELRGTAARRWRRLPA